MPYQLLEQLYLIDLCAGCKKIWTYLRLIKPVWALFGLNFCLSPANDFTVRCLPVLIPDTFEKKTYLVRAQFLLTFFDVEIFRYFQNLKVRLNLYFCKEFLLPLLSVLLGAVGLRVSFFLPHLFSEFY